MTSPILSVAPLGFPWPTVDPFLLCVHHDDRYPKGNGRFGPAASLAGHRLGEDFVNDDGWRMYHGRDVPGFPPHPHRGFETVTIVRRGWIDHSDSLGASARYGEGDVQWLTAGRGVVHAEMFPLLDTTAPNPLELFQIWLNLPSASKFAPPHFTMFWSDDIPRIAVADASGAGAEVVCIAGALADGAASLAAPAPPPHSWAAAPASDVAIWTVRLGAGARWTLPPARERGTRRNLYFFAGDRLSVGCETLDEHAVVEVAAEAAIELVHRGSGTAELLLLQGRPIGEPVAQRGPFVMNSEREIEEAFGDYRRTQFGGWPWPDTEPVLGPEPARFASYAGGRIERPAR